MGFYSLEGYSVWVYVDVVFCGYCGLSGEMCVL